MDLKQRRIIYLTFFAVFFIATPLLLAFSLGYRLTLQPFNIYKVGAAFIKSYPGDASIFLNDQYTKKRTPHQLLNVPPGTNTFTVTKDGYQTWTKRLDIQPGLTTFIEDILLFKEDFKPVVIGEGGTKIFNRDKKLYYQTSDGEVYVLDANTEEVKLLAELPALAEVKVISNNDRALIYVVADQWFWYSIERDLTRPLSNLVAAEIDEIIFGSNQNELWLRANDVLYSYNLEDNQVVLFARDVIDQYFDGSRILSISSDWKLQQTEISTQTTLDNDLQLSPNSEILEKRNNIILIQQGNDIRIIKDFEVIDAFSASSYDWLNDRILLTDSHELWLYNLSTQSAVLIDRTGADLVQSRIHPSLSYYTRLQDDKLEIVEIDARGNKRHTIFIADLTPEESFIYNSDGELVYILTPDGLTEYTLQ